MFENIKKSLRHTRLYRNYRNWYGKKSLQTWEKAGCPLPPPHYYKQQVLLDFAQKNTIKIFIETGTHKGSTLLMMLPFFEKLYSIEVFEPLYKAALETFKAYPKVNLILGDSAEQMPLLLQNLQEPAVFWLDGHFSGEGTGKAQKHTPVMEELKAIVRHTQKHVIVIDDARLFNGENDYPTLEMLQAWLKSYPQYPHFEVLHDLIRIY